MSELTKDQIEASAKVAYQASRRSSFQDESKFPLQVYWDALSEQTRQDYRAGVRAAAPFLQLPWSTPSYEEMKTACAKFARTESRINTWMGVPTYPMMNALADFVCNRNFELTANPVDPRIALFVELFHKNHPTMMSPTDLAKEILELLDRKE